MITMLVHKMRQRPKNYFCVSWKCIQLGKEDAYAEIGSGCQVFFHYEGNDDTNNQYYQGYCSDWLGIIMKIQENIDSNHISDQICSVIHTASFSIWPLFLMCH